MPQVTTRSDERFSSSGSVSIPTCHRTRESPLVWTSSQTRSQAQTRRQETHRPHTRCHPAWALEGTLVGPGKDTHGTPVPTQWENRGWPTTSYTRHHQHDKTKVAVSRLGSQHYVCENSNKPSFFFTCCRPFRSANACQVQTHQDDLRADF